MTLKDTQFVLLDGSIKTLSADLLQSFRVAFRGALLHADDAGYDEARRVWNAMIDRRPALIARCSGVADVVHAVRFAKAHALRCSVRGGGHNIAGLAICERGLVIDLSAMRGVWTDPSNHSVHAQAGCTLADVDRETQLHGQAAVLGFISPTGIAGLTTGGGFGWLTRRAGWTCDQVSAMEVVTAAGEVVHASESENSELFWCLRGGSGNFGIVTSFTYRTHDVGPEVVAGAVAWSGEHSREVLNFFRDFSATAPRELTCALILRNAPPAPWLPKDAHGKQVAIMLAVHSGTPADGERLTAPIKAFGKPIADILTRRPYAQMQSLLDGTQPAGRRYYWKSEYLPGIDAGLVDLLEQRATQLPSPHTGLILFQIGGALNALPAEHSPVGNRDAAYVANIASSWEASADDAPNIAWTRETWQALRNFSTGGAYLNFMTDDEGSERTYSAYGGANLARLAELKRRFDPDNLFQHTKSVLDPARG